MTALDKVFAGAFVLALVAVIVGTDKTADFIANVTKLLSSLIGTIQLQGGSK